MSAKLGEIYRVNNKAVLVLGYASVKKVRIYPICTLEDLKYEGYTDIVYKYFNECKDRFLHLPYDVNKELSSCREKILVEKNKLGCLKEDLVKLWYLKSNMGKTTQDIKPLQEKGYFENKLSKERFYDATNLVIGQVFIDLNSGQERVYLGNNYYLPLYDYMLREIRYNKISKKLTKAILDCFHNPDKPLYRKNVQGILTDLVLDVDELRKELGIVV